jgi:hypothetical protein
MNFGTTTKATNKGPIANRRSSTEKWIVPNPRFPPDAKKGDSGSFRMKK